MTTTSLGDDGVLIPLERKANSIQEWAMIELQGSLDVRHYTTASSSSSYERLEIGTLALKENVCSNLFFFFFFSHNEPS